MPIPFTCHTCGHSGEAKDELAGQIVRCSKCQTDFKLVFQTGFDTFTVPSIRTENQKETAEEDSIEGVRERIKQIESAMPQLRTYGINNEELSTYLFDQRAYKSFLKKKKAGRIAESKQFERYTPDDVWRRCHRYLADLKEFNEHPWRNQKELHRLRNKLLELADGGLSDSGQSKWYVKTGEQVRGPVTVKQLRAMAGSGKLPANSLLSLDRKKWVNPSRVKGLVFKPVENTTYAPPPIRKRSTNQEIQQAGIKDRFSPLDNPFGVLGLSADTSGKKIHEHAQRLRIRLKFDKSISDEFVNRVELACEKLNDPVTRYYHGAFWVTLNEQEEKQWNEHPVLSSLAEGWNVQAIAAYETIATHESLAVRSHNKAVLELGNALALTEVESVKLKSAWQRAFKSWMLLAQSNAFSEMIKHRAKELDDPRLSARQVSQWQAQIPSYLMQYCSLRASASLISHNIEEASLWVDCIRDSVFSDVEKNKVLETVYEPFTLAIEHAIDQWKAKLTHKPDEKLVDEIANGVIREVLPKVSLILTLGDLPGRAEEAARDRCAEFLRNLAMTYNHLDLNEKAIKLIEKAKKIADASALTEILEEDSIEIRAISITSVAYDQCRQGDYAGALSYLDDCLKEENRIGIRDKIQEARKFIAHQYATQLFNDVMESLEINYEATFKQDGGKTLERLLKDALKSLKLALAYESDPDDKKIIQKHISILQSRLVDIRGIRSKKNQCFVATATFDDPSDEVVRLLRSYRDLVLARSRVGRLFIRLYYRVGPYLAHCVERWPIAKLFLRPVLRKVAHKWAQSESYRIAKRAGNSQL